LQVARTFGEFPIDFCAELQQGIHVHVLKVNAEHFTLLTGYLGPLREKYDSREGAHSSIYQIGWLSTSTTVSVKNVPW
jgi:hypothetical protein